MTPRHTLALLVAGAACAQQLEHRIGTYKAASSFEFGSRSVFVDGNREVYRSAVNYENGFRLFDGFLRLNSGGGDGRFADEIVLTMLGSAGDPYQANSLRLEKNRWYRLDLGFRVVNYYNHLAVLSGGEHRFNTERIFQNYDLTLFPMRRFQFLLGFDRVNQNGPALNSQSIDVRGEPAFPRDRFFVFADNVRRVNDTWRLGGNLSAGPVKISLLQGWDFYKEDTTHSLDGAGREPTLGLVAPSHRRSDPVHGLTPFSRLGVHTDANRSFAVNGRLVWAGGERRFVLDESLTSLNPISGVAVTRQAFVLGSGRRSQASGDGTLTWQPGRRWTLSNVISVNQTRITGDSAFVEVRSPANRFDPDRNEYFFDLLAIRMISNASDVSFRLTPRVGLYGGYHYSIRRVQSRENLRDDPEAPPFELALDSFENSLHSGLAGLRLRPFQALTMLFDVEVGRANRPFTPVSEKRFHAETLRVQWKRKTWLATGSFKNYRNRNNPPPVLGALEATPASVHSFENRQFSATLGWAPPRRYTLDAGYSYLQLNTASGIVNFPVPNAAAVASRRSLYESTLHHLHTTVRAEIHSKATVAMGYSLVKDTAGGRRPESVADFGRAYPSVLFDGSDAVNAYPLSYHAPQVRLSFHLHRKLSWNLGWQYYNYAERFTGIQDYTAHLATASLRWSF